MSFPQSFTDFELVNFSEKFLKLVADHICKYVSFSIHLYFKSESFPESSKKQKYFMLVQQGAKQSVLT